MYINVFQNDMAYPRDSQGNVFTSCHIKELGMRQLSIHIVFMKEVDQNMKYKLYLSTSEIDAETEDNLLIWIYFLVS